jgi:hypothetical protein
LLEAMRRRPGMFLGQASVTLLAAFFRGYVLASQDAHLFAEEVPDFDDFSRWLSARHKMRKNYRWDRLLLFFHRSEADSLEEFFKHFADYDAGPNSTP